MVRLQHRLKDGIDRLALKPNIYLCLNNPDILHVHIGPVRWEEFGGTCERVDNVFHPRTVKSGWFLNQPNEPILLVATIQMMFHR